MDVRRVVDGMGSQRVVRTWSTVRAQPSWVTRACLTAFFLVLLIPIVLLFVFALVVATVVFALLWCVNRVGMLFRGSRDIEGRENVKVIRRQ